MDIKKFLMLGIAAAALSNFAINTAHANDTATLTIDAVIVEAITLNCGTNLNFGDIVSPSGAGTVVMPVGGTRSGTGGVTGAELIGNAGGAGQCDIDGASGQVATLTISEPIQISDGGSNNMDVGSFTVSVGGGASEGLDNAEVTLGADPIDLDIGATLTVDAGQAAGAYQGTIEITANYN